MLIVELVTPWSVAPVACPLPQGEGSVPNVVVEGDDEAPLTEGEITSPVAVSEVSSSANPTTLMAVSLFMIQPPVCRAKTCWFCAGTLL